MAEPEFQNLCYVVGIGLILLGLVCLLRWFFKEH